MADSKGKPVVDRGRRAQKEREEIIKKKTEREKRGQKGRGREEEKGEAEW